MKLKSRILTIVLSLALLLGSMSVFTAVAVDYSYTDFRITGFVKQVDRIIYLSTDVAIPGNWDQYVGLDIKYDGKPLYYVTNANEGVKNAGTGTTQLVLPLLSNGEWNARQVGTKLEITASTATAKGDADYNGDGRPDAIRLVESYNFVYDGTTWVPDVPDTTVYTELNATGVVLAQFKEGSSGNRWEFYVKVDGTIPGVADSAYNFSPFTVTVKNGAGTVLVNKEYEASYAGYDGGTLYFRIPESDLSRNSVDAGTTVTIAAGKAKPDKDCNGIDLLNSYTMQYDGTKWATFVPDTTVYTELNATGLKPESQFKEGTSGKRWDFYLTMDNAIPGVGDSDYNFSPFYVTVVNAGGTVLVDNMAFSATHSNHGPSLYLRIPEETLSKDSVDVGTKVTFAAGKAKPNKDCNGVELMKSYTAEWNGSNWVPYVPDTTVYTELNMTGVSLAQFKEGSSGNRWEFYVKVDGTIPGVADSAYNFSSFIVTVKNAGGMVLLEKAYAASYAGYDGGTLYFRIPEEDLPQTGVTAGTTVTFAAGKAKPDKDCNGIELLAPYTVQYDGSKWGTYVVDTTVYTELNPTGLKPESQFKVGSTGIARWDFYLTVDNVIPGVGDSAYNFSPFYVTVVNAAGTVLVDNMAFSATHSNHGPSLYLRIPVETLSQESVDVGTKVTFAAGKAKPDKDCNGVELMKSYTAEWNGSNWIPYLTDKTVYSDMTVADLVGFSTDNGDWRFNLSVENGWPLVEGNLPKLTDLSVYINQTKLDPSVVDLYKNGENLMVSLWGNLTAVAPVKGDKVTVKAGQAQFENTELGIDLLRDVVLEFDGEKWAMEGYVDNHVYSDVTLKLPIYPSNYSAEKNRWLFYFPVEGTIPGNGDDGENSIFDSIKITVHNSEGELVLNKGSFRTWKASHGGGTLYFLISGDYLPMEKVDKGSVMTIHAGKLSCPSNNNGINIVSDFQMKWTGSDWLSVDYDSLKPSETDVKLSIDRSSAYGGTAGGVYLLTEDQFPVDTTWGTRIPAATYDEYSGIYLNGELIENSTICRFAEGKLYVALRDAGVVAQDKDKLVIRGAFFLDGYGVSYKEYTLYFNGKHWNEKYVPAPKETYTKFTVEKVSGQVSKYNTNSNRWNIYLALDTMIPGDVDTMSFEGLTLIGSNGKEYSVYVSHSWEHNLFLPIPDEALPYATSETGDYVILKAGKALSSQDKTSGIELTKDIKLYFYKGTVSELEPTTDTLFEEVTVTRLNQAGRFNQNSKMWTFHWVIATPIENVDTGVTFSEFMLEINGVTHEIPVMRDGDYLYIRIPESILPANTQTAVIKAKAGTKGYANAGHNGILLANDWTAYIYRGVLSEIEFEEVQCQEFDIIGVQAATPSAGGVHLYLRTNRDIPGTAWYETYPTFTYYYNDQKVMTSATKSGSSNNKVLYVSVSYQSAGIEGPQEGDMITIPVGSFGDCGGYQIKTTNEFSLIYSDGLWVQYVENDVEPPVTVEGSIWEHFRFEEGYIPMLRDDNKTLWSNEDQFHKIISTEKHKDYSFSIEVKKLYDDETTAPFKVILRGNPVSEQDPMTTSMLYGYVIELSAAKIQDPADPNNPDAKIWSQYVSLWKNGINTALIDQYRINYVHDRSDHPFFQYEATHNYEFSVYNINETTACITVKIDGRLALRYYDVTGGADPMDPAVNEGLFVVSAGCPGLVTGEAVDLGELMVSATECEINDRVQLAVTYPSILEGAVFTVDGEGATITDGVFVATKPGTYTIHATYNGKDYGSKTIVVKEPPKRDLLEVDGDEKEFPWLIVGIAGGAVLLIAAIVVVLLIVKKKKKANA